MSRLDWFTIILVTLLLGALGFLIYRTVQLIQQDDSKAPKTELAAAPNTDNAQTPGSAQSDNTTSPDTDEQDLDDDELSYDPQEVEAPTKKEETTTDRTAKTATNTAAEKKPAPEPTRTASAETTPKGGTPTSYSSSSTGEYMVVAGSFSLRHNADNQVSYLKEIGYKNARVVMTKGGALASAMVDRFADRNSANKLIDELKGKGVEAIVKKEE
ncbi:MAG: SPOR domain-containing protein [Saprospiraceae bacterium]|nr:SPOR domain-containing protein [Lewinella sp.]